MLNVAIADVFDLFAFLDTDSSRKATSSSDNSGSHARISKRGPTCLTG